jgi:hypothetical protein
MVEKYNRKENIIALSKTALISASITLLIMFVFGISINDPIFIVISSIVAPSVIWVLVKLEKRKENIIKTQTMV